MTRNPITRVVSKMRNRIKEMDIKHGEVSDCVDCAGLGIISLDPEWADNDRSSNSICLSCNGTGVKR